MPFGLGNIALGPRGQYWILPILNFWCIVYVELKVTSGGEMHDSNTFGSIQFLTSCAWEPLKPITRFFKGTFRGPDTVSGTPDVPLRGKSVFVAVE